MTTARLPTDDEMMQAFQRGDAEFDGIFVTAVRTTGIFCRPTCPAKKPRPENVSFYATPREALQDGYRPCKRCRPLEAAHDTPAWLRPLLADIEADPARRWRDADLRARDLTPERVRRWFQAHHGMTFHAYSRARRLGSALGQVHGGAPVTQAAFASGFDSLSGFHEAFQRYFGAAPSSVDGTAVVRVDRLSTPLGPMLVGATDEALCLLEFIDRRALPTQVRRLRQGLRATFVPGRTEVIARTQEQIGAYFAGQLRAFSLPLTMPGTEFQLLVWQALQRIPYGETRSYADLAGQIGRPAAVRAVGTTNGLNALAIVVPCHRVVGADGRLTGYGGGLWRKQRLLELEGAR